jgi:hypothetical protein
MARGVKRWTVLLRGITADNREAQTVADALHAVCRELGHPEAELVTVETWVEEQSCVVPPPIRGRTWEAEHAQQQRPVRRRK